MVEVIGTRISGIGMATRNLAVQIPLISQEFPEVSGCHRGTINLKLDHQLIVHSPDYRTKPIPWDRSFGAGEIFDFVRVEIETPIDTDPIPAWLYIPHGSPHRNTPDIHEVLVGRYLPKLGDSRCKIRIDRDYKVYNNGRYRLIVIT